MGTINKKLKVDSTWTLFLDRDGIINERVAGYITDWNQFIFKKDFLKSISKLSKVFSKIILITNQQGIGKGLMTEHDLEIIHHNMNNLIHKHGGRIDQVYYCPHLAEENCSCRKPKPGMAVKAKDEFSGIDYKKTVMIGDTPNDMIFGKNLGMVTVYIPSREEDFSDFDYCMPDLTEALKIFETGK